MRSQKRSDAAHCMLCTLPHSLERVPDALVSRAQSFRFRNTRTGRRCVGVAAGASATPLAQQRDEHHAAAEDAPLQRWLCCLLPRVLACVSVLVVDHTCHCGELASPRTSACTRTCPATPASTPSRVNQSDCRVGRRACLRRPASRAPAARSPAPPRHAASLLPPQRGPGRGEHEHALAGRAAAPLSTPPPPPPGSVPSSAKLRCAWHTRTRWLGRGRLRGHWRAVPAARRHRRDGGASGDVHARGALRHWWRQVGLPAGLGDIRTLLIARSPTVCIVGAHVCSHVRTAAAPAPLCAHPCCRTHNALAARRAG